MRYVIYGAGAVGGTIGANLALHGHDVVLLARGAHARALREDGLRFADPEGVHVVRIPVAESPAALAWRADDVVVLAVKSQDTPAALDALAASAPPTTPIVCAQNGVDNERQALRRFAGVYAMCVMLPGTHLEPGSVIAHSAPIHGILDLGRYPTGIDERAVAIAGDLDAASFSSHPDPAIMRLKYRKLLLNLGNALEAACGPAARTSPLYERACDEALRCYAAAGIDAASAEEDRARRGDLLRLGPVEGAPRSGGSTWQSLARKAPSTEADLLNGEIVLLGRLHGVATPVNEVLQRIAAEMAARGEAPGSRSIEDVERAVAAVEESARG